MDANSTPPVIKLPANIKQSLTDLTGTVKKARHDIAVMKKLGMDTRSLEDKLDWAENARKTLLSEFG